MEVGKLKVMAVQSAYRAESGSKSFSRKCLLCMWTTPETENQTKCVETPTFFFKILALVIAYSVILDPGFMYRLDCTSFYYLISRAAIFFFLGKTICFFSHPRGDRLPKDTRGCFSWTLDVVECLRKIKALTPVCLRLWPSGAKADRGRLLKVPCICEYSSTWLFASVRITPWNAVCERQDRK